MEFKYILKNPKPDFKEFIDIIKGKKKVKNVPLVEYIVDDIIMKPVIENLLNREWVPYSKNDPNSKKYFDNYIEFWFKMGYSFVRFENSLPFIENQNIKKDENSEKQRAWQDEHQGSITNWDEFEKYQWPKVEDMDYSAFEYISKNLHEGMGFITSHGGGIFEHLSWIMSYEGLSIAIYDDPELVEAVANKIGELIFRFYENVLDLENVIAIFQGDDMGFKTGTMISPNDLRKYCLPWLKKYSELTHLKGKPFFLHSCGNLMSIMEDLITDVKIDAKHSFEDVIIPVEDFQSNYGDRIGVLGGIDLNILAGGTMEDVRKRVDFLMENCGSKGRFAIGSGNSIPSYVPVENYLAMIDEVHKINYY